MTAKLKDTQRIVIKLGTQVVMGVDGLLAKKRLVHLVLQMASLSREGKEVLLVTSGAVGFGRQALGLLEKPLTLAEKQACAAVGQTLLMDIYRELFDAHGFLTAQLLLTATDFADRKRYLNLKDTLEKLLALHVIPVINENDPVSTTELAEDKAKSFGDNDKLSALVASKLGADLLVILTSVEGIYTANPETNPEAEHIPLVEGFDALKTIATDGQTLHGRGGMASKLEAVKIAALGGVNTFITSGFKDNTILNLFSDTPPLGTLITARRAIPGKKRWLGLASGYEGVVVVNEGAKKALIDRHASLLPSGVIHVHGDFTADQVVSLQDESGFEIGRGLIDFSAEDARKIQGRQSSEISKLLGHEAPDVMIHRDNLVIYQDYDS